MRGGNVAGAALATVCGIATAYTTFVPALEEEAERKAGTFEAQHGTEGDNVREKDTQLSRAILSDLKEAKKQAIGEDQGRGGFAWGIRQWFWSSGEPATKTNGEDNAVKAGPGVSDRKEANGK